jgi:hypothetical protein
MATYECTVSGDEVPWPTPSTVDLGDWNSKDLDLLRHTATLSVFNATQTHRATLTGLQWGWRPSATQTDKTVQGHWRSGRGVHTVDDHPALAHICRRVIPFIAMDSTAPACEARLLVAPTAAVVTPQSSFSRWLPTTVASAATSQGPRGTPRRSAWHQQGVDTEAITLRAGQCWLLRQESSSVVSDPFEVFVQLRGGGQTYVAQAYVPQVPANGFSLALVVPTNATQVWRISGIRVESYGMVTTQTGGHLFWLRDISGISTRIGGPARVVDLGDSDGSLPAGLHVRVGAEVRIPAESGVINGPQTVIPTTSAYSADNNLLPYFGEILAHPVELTPGHGFALIYAGQRKESYPNYDHRSRNQHLPFDIRCLLTTTNLVGRPLIHAT